MPSTALLPAPEVSGQLQTQLIERTQAQMLEPAHRHGYELRLLGATVLPQRQTIAKTQWGQWLFVNHVDDPTKINGRVPIPQREFDKLVSLDRAGVRPDLVWLAHELPAGWEEPRTGVMSKSQLPALVPPPRHLREKDQRLTQQLKVGTKLFLKAAGGTLAIAASAPLVAGAAAVSAVGLDPIILGGVRHPHAPVVQWVLLAQWDWE